MFRREMGSKRGSLPPKEGDLTCMPSPPAGSANTCVHLIYPDILVGLSLGISFIMLLP